MQIKWSKIREAVYSDPNGLGLEVEQYQWEALKNNYSKRAKQLYSFSQDPKSNWSAATSEPKKWEEEMLDGIEEENERAELANEKSKNSVKLQKTLEAIEREAVSEKCNNEEEKQETTMKKGFTVAANPYESLQKVVESFNDPAVSEARLLDARANLLKAEAEAKKIAQSIETEKENLQLMGFEIENAAELAKARMEIEKRNSESNAQLAMAFLELAKSKKE